MISRRTILGALGAAALPLPAIVGNIDIGVCGSAVDFEKAEQFGFDYYEPSAAATAVLSEQAFADFAKRVGKSRIRCDCFNGFIRTLTVTGPAVDNDALISYMNSALDRCRMLGASIVVWGSASSRNIPEGFPRDRAWQQMVSFLRMAAPLAKSRNIVIAIEPLRKQESNIINSGAEAYKLVREVEHPNVKMIIDYYHLAEEHEDPQILEEARDAIVHLHFANPAGRVWPKDPAENPGYAPFFAMLKKTGFRGGLSIEGRGTFEADAAASLAFFRKELA
jgi:D-psicose/D-tagatose/L-ribulose 3-epimerase